ncbi:hypothetical protein [Paenibacillus chitinolyticus]|uniref:hypothetical protein n=1 Tax=Paenibacillus chitinolyticus TaxID=79263 RepID=UPI0036715A08
MVHTKTKSYSFKVGKNQFLVIKIFQTAVSKTRNGNALASNAANVKVFKKDKKR